MNRAMRWSTLLVLLAVLGCRESPPTGADGSTPSSREQFSASLLLDGFVVNSADDVDDGACNTAHCSLREAINAANAQPGFDSIVFDVRGRPGPRTIRPLSPLPSITDAVLIDGYTQQGASPNTNPPGLAINAVLMIELDGSASSASSGLVISAGNSTVRGLVLNRFGTSLVLHTNGGNAIEGNFLGTDVTGTMRASPFFDATGVEILGSPANRIGGTTAAARNIISGNFRGIEIFGGSAAGTVIQGNFIGTDVTGTVALSEGNGNGIRLNDVSDITVGGSVPGAGNLISGNGFGVVILGGAGVVVAGNFIGTDVTGSVALGNLSDGILSGGGATIGGTAPGAGNVISGNGFNGVSVSSGGNAVQGNMIGTDRSGSVDLGNGFDGVSVGFGSGTTIGGTVAGARNIISGNNSNGVSISSSGNLVQGNLIGTDVTGTLALGNFEGVRILLGVENTIGGTVPSARNLISGNSGPGVHILGGSATGNLVQGNFIGGDLAGTSSIGNFGDGVRVEGAPGNTIGGTAPAAGNLITGNNGVGVVILHGGATVQGNTITANGSGGVLLILAGAGNAIRSNSIFSNGGLGIDLDADGVTLNDPGDGDAGSNDRQNFPVLTSIVRGSRVISGTLESTPNAQFVLEFFSSRECDPSNHGEGESLLGSTTVMTRGNGHAKFKVTLTTPVPDSHSFVTATATNSLRSTSEFSQCSAVT